MAASFETISQEYEMGFADLSTQHVAASCVSYSDISCHAGQTYETVSGYMSGINIASFGVHAIALMAVLVLLGGLGLFFAYYFVRMLINRRKRNAAAPVVVNHNNNTKAMQTNNWMVSAGKLPVIVKRGLCLVLKLALKALYLVAQILAWVTIRIGWLHAKCATYHAALNVPTK